MKLLLVAGLVLGGNLARAKDALHQAKILWKFSFNYSPFGRLITPPDGRKNSSSSTPALAPDGTIYVGTFNGKLYAVSPNGKAKWQFKAGLEIHSSPAIGDKGTIYFGSRDRHLYALTPLGKLKWKFSTGGWVDSSPAIAKDGTIYFGSWDHYFYALNPDGSLKWKFKTGDIVDSSPAIAADGTIYFGSHDKNFYALNPDGSLRWKFKTRGEIISSPAIGKSGVIYFSSLDGNLYALNPDGSLRWKIHTGSWTQSSPVLDAAENIGIGQVHALNVYSPEGKKAWHYGSPTPLNISGATAGDQFYDFLAWFKLNAASNRGLHWTVDLKQNASSSPTVGPKGIIFVCAGNYLFAIRPPGNLLPKADGPWPMFRGNAQHTGRQEE